MSTSRTFALLVMIAAAGRAAPTDPLFEVTAELKIAEGLAGFAGPLEAVDAFGSAVAVLGDLDGNGVADLAVGAPNASTPPGGAVWILFLQAGDTVLAATRLDATSASLPLDGNDQFGAALAALGDLDDDGNPELAVGAPNFGPGVFLGPGAVFVLTLDATATVLAARELSEGVNGVPAPVSGTGFGNSLAAIGDLDVNGVTDLAVGDWIGASSSQVVWLLQLQADATALAATPISSSAPAFGGLPVTGSGFGRSLAALGDLDGNGTADLAIGEPGAGATDEGAAWVALLDAGPGLASAMRIAEAESGFDGMVEDQAGFGNSLAAGDIDADGQTELVVGASMGDVGAGGAWILGLDTAGLVTSTMQVAEGLQGFTGPLADYDQFASSVALLPEVGGAAQLVAGARGDQSAFLLGSGAAWILDLEPSDPWFDLGHALAGTTGDPLLQGVGPLTDGSDNSLDLTNALPGSTTSIIVGFAALEIGFKGGLLVPSPDVLVIGLPLDGTGALSIPFVWPSGVPSGVSLWFQHWISDPAGPKGFAASNGLKAITP